MPTDAHGILEWIDSVLGAPQYGDVTRKLLKRQADERHVFLMTGSATPFGVQELLWRVRSALPTSAPAVPAGITHVWTTTQFAPPTAVSTALWGADSGWSAIETRPKRKEPLTGDSGRLKRSQMPLYRQGPA